MKKNKQLVEDIFDDFILKMLGWDINSPHIEQVKPKIMDYITFKLVKSLLGREKAGVVVYVGDDCAAEINRGAVSYRDIYGDGYNHFKNKAIIQVVEDL